MALRKKKTPEYESFEKNYYDDYIEQKSVMIRQMQALQLAQQAAAFYDKPKEPEVVPLAINPDLKPTGDERSHKQRMKRLGTLTASLAYEVFQSSPFFSPEATRETMEGTQFGDENHRRITPYLQELYNDDVVGLMETLDTQADEASFGLLSPVQALNYNVAIIGSGPHGAAFAAYLREKMPELRVVIIEGNKVLGGQWRSYGPKPVFQMNSRVRKADRRLPALPRTAASINPLGMFASLELSDIPTGGYPWNTDMGNVCALNGYLAATDVMVGAKVTAVQEGAFDYDKNRYRKQIVLQTGYGERYMTADYVVDASGLGSTSRIVGQGFDKPGYFTPKTFYEHFASHASPLEAFAGLNVAVIGRGDSALTVLEALIGNLPTQTYGRSGIGRMRPKRIDWLGAPRADYSSIDSCLRTRYKNGIVQSIRRDAQDECGVIVPNRTLVENLESGGQFFDLRLAEDLDGNSGATLFPNIVVDCTATARRTKQLNDGFMPDYFVGVQTGRSLPNRIARAVEDLRIPENNVSLWATMGQTDELAADLVSRFA